MELVPSEILCCECGTPIQSNPANMCVSCLRARVDVTEGIPKQGTIYFCKFCERYLQPPATWMNCALESRELLGLCLKKLKGLNQVHLVDASFVWTEPHSKRIKVKLTVQKEVFGSTILQQVFLVEYVVHYQMCSECQRRQASDFWQAVVQLRQKINHKKTFFYLEQLILKHKAHNNTLRIKEIHNGLDFFYASKSEARKMVDFLMAIVPCRYQYSQRLISHDTHSNTFNYKHTFSVEIVPVCKDDVVCLPPKVAQTCGSISPIVLCRQVSNSIHLIDPTTLQAAEVPAAVFWRYPFESLCDSRRLTEYIVLDVESAVAVHHRLPRAPHSKFVLAEVCVSKTEDLGLPDSQVYCKTHLGHLLKAGDTVLGFDLANSNVNNDYLSRVPSRHVPDVVLVKKSYGDKKRGQNRIWKLKHLAKDASEAMNVGGNERDYQEFLNDLEEDPTYRKDVNVYKDQARLVAARQQQREDDLPEIGLEEMLEDLTLEEDKPDEEEGEMPMQ
eukprot:m.105562 g.105562  ORF g.105562 m.105562 type:complete len:501 (+) comp37230_c0_seq10:145-1647(+)